MVIDDDSIINYRERKDKSNSKEIKESKRGIENIDYISVKGSVCSETPARITNN